MPSSGKGTLNYIIFAISGILICLIGACCLGVIFSDPTKILSTPTAEKILTLNEMIALTSSAAAAQTSAAYTSTPFPTLYPTSTLAPTFTPIPTITPFILFSPSQRAAPGISACSCSSDTYNCSDFNSHAEAQACFDACTNEGAGDIHKLDENNDGDACESLR